MVTGDFDVTNDSALLLASADGDWGRIAQEGPVSARADSRRAEDAF